MSMTDREVRAVGQRVTGRSWLWATASGLALGTAMLAASPAAAAQECGADPASTTPPVSCAAGTYANGITYTPTNGLTLNLNDPGIVVQGQGVVVSSQAANTGDIVINAANFGSITTSTTNGVSATNIGGGGAASVTMGAGAISTTSGFRVGLVANNTNAANAGAASATLNGGSISTAGDTAYGVEAVSAGVAASATATVTMTGGSIQTTGRAAGIRAAVTGAGSAAGSFVFMSGGSILTTNTTLSTGITSSTQGSGTAQVRMSGGTVQSNQNDGIFATSFGTGVYDVGVSGGTVTGGSGTGAAVHVAATAGGTLTIGSGATINAGGSGVAISQTGGIVNLSTGGTINGAVNLAGVANALTVTGGSITGDVTGGGLTTLRINAAGDSFTYGAGHAMNGLASVTMNAGSAEIDGAINTTGSLTVNNGTLQLKGGGTITTPTLTNITGNATLVVDGAGSMLTTSTFQLQSAANTTTTVLIENGGAVRATSTNTSTLTNWANAANANVNVTVTGAGSRLDISHSLAISSPPTTATSVLVANGAAMTVAGRINLGPVAQAPSTPSTLQVDGPGSSLTVGNVLGVYHGTVEATGGGSITVGSLSLSGTNGSANLLVAGAGSNVTSTGAVVLGASNNGTGVVALADGGVLTAPSVAISAGASRTGVINIGGAEGAAATGAGTLDSPTLAFGAGTGRLNFNHTDTNYTFAAAVSGSGAINQVAGVTHLTGDSSGFTGASTVSGGTLWVDGSLAASAVDVLSGATLAGSGTVGTTTIHSGGIVAPGNSTSVLHVNGAFVQQAGSVYQVQIDPASSRSSQIAVTGPATLAPGASLKVVKAGSGAYRPGAVYTVLAASGGVSGTFALAGDIQPVSAFLALKDSYDAGHAYLTVVQTLSPADAGQPGNQQATGGALPVDNPVTDPLLNLPDIPAARNALSQLSGEAHAAAKGVLVADSRLVRDLATDRVRGVLCAPGTAERGLDPKACQDDHDRPTTWAQGFGAWGRSDSTLNASGARRSTEGFLIGGDLPVTAVGRAGVFAGYSRTSVDVDSGHADIDNYHAGVYGGLQTGRLGLRAGASFTYHAVDSGRSVAFPGFQDRLQSAYGAHTAQGYAEAGYELPSAAPVSVEGFANIAYASMHNQGFTESGGAAALTTRAQDTDVTYTTLGLRPSAGVDVAAMRVSLRGLIGWRYAFGDITPTSTVAFAGGRPFTVDGVPLARNSLVAEFGADLRLSDRATFGLTYTSQHAASEADQSLRAELSFRF